MAKKIFISIPMRGRDEYDILTVRDRIMAAMRTMGDYELLETYQRDDAPPGAGRLWYLGRSVQDLGLADLVIFAPGWEYAKGCLVEHMVCDNYGVPYVEWEQTTEGLIKLLQEEGDDRK